MFVELHLLQSFAPSNLNRDDTGAPKECEFGGYRRARISSQSLKRAIRTQLASSGWISEDALAVRTKRVASELVGRFVDAGRDADQAKAVAERVVENLGISTVRQRQSNELETSYLVFLGERTIRAATDLASAHWEALATAKPGALGDKALAGEIRSLLDADSEKAVDVALFGRMLADKPAERNVDAACQVAHAISTHAVSREFDFYTAVDDLKSRDEEADAGASMMGTIEFNAATHYRYANLDAAQLLRNLQGDEGLARQATEAFLRSAVEAIPIGKQNSMAAHNLPFMVLAVVRNAGCWNLANAFLRPVDAASGLATASQSALAGHWNALHRMYGASTITGSYRCSLDEDGLDGMDGVEDKGSIDGIVEAVMGKVAYE